MFINWPYRGPKESLCGLLLKVKESKVEEFLPFRYNPKWTV